MNVSVGKRLEEFVARLVSAGRYSSSSEVVRKGLHLIEEREARLKTLRDTIDRSVERGGGYTDGEVDAAIHAKAEELAREGY
jgi:antitoxin ParD1/3/4